MFKRRRFDEAKSWGYYVIRIIFILLIVLSTIFIICFKINYKVAVDLVAAVMSVSGVMLGFAVALFILYFGLNFKEEIKKILYEFGFFFKFPRDMLRTTIFFGVSILLLIISFFLKNIACFLFCIYGILTLLWGIVVLIYVICRFLKVIKKNLAKNTLPK